MLLLTVVLGVAFAWLVTIAWEIFTKGKSEDEVTKLFDRLRIWASPVVLIIFIVLVTIVISGSYGWITGKWSSRAVRWLHYLTLPRLQAGVAGFVLGALAVWLRARIASVLSDLFAPKKGKKEKAAAASAESEGATGAKPTGKEPYPWLAGIVGIAAVTLVAVVALVIFFPELLTRVESIKVAGVEARFATAATRSIQVGTQTEIAIKGIQILNPWAYYEQDRANLDTIQNLISRHWTAPRESRDRITSGRIWDAGDKFLLDIAAPLARAILCRSQGMSLEGTETQRQVARIANGWGALFDGGTNIDSKDPKERDEAEKRFKDVVDATYKLIFAAQAEEGPCEWKPIIRGNTGAHDKLQEDATARLTAGLADYRRNGFAVGFISNLHWFSYSPTRAVEFLERMAGKYPVDHRRGTLRAQQFFYIHRAEAKFSAGLPARETIEDLKEAIDAIEIIIACIRMAGESPTTDHRAACGKSPTVGSGPHPPDQIDATATRRSYETTRIRLLNNHLYYVIRDWLGGRRLLESEVLVLEGLPTGGLAYEISEWMKKQSLTVLRERNPSALQWVATFHDTLATRDIALGSIKNDFGRERCARILGHLTSSRGMLDKIDNPEAREALRSINAHYNLYESVCDPRP